MPNQREIRWSQLKVGVLVIIALAVLTMLIFLMSDTSGGLFTRQIVVHSFFKNASGLNVGSPVNLQGVKIGTVQKITIDPKRKETPVEVIMKIGTHYQTALHTDSTASLTTAGVLGNTFVDIDSSHATGPELKNGDELPIKNNPSLSDIIQSSQVVVAQLNQILAKVNTLADSLGAGKGTLGKFINDPKLYNEAVATLDQAQSIIKQVNQGRGTLGKMIADPTLYDNANRTIAQLQDIVAQIDAGKGTVGKLVKDPSLYNNLNGVVGGINQGKGSLGMLAKNEAFRNKLNDTITNLQGITRSINQGQGTVGKLMHDPTLYNTSNSTLVEMKELLAAIRQNPKKYLVIRLKIF